MEDWYKDAFSRDYLEIYRHRDVTEAESTIDQLLSLIDLPVRPLCLDLCCGFGRHLDYLNRRGTATIGIDLSPILLNHALELDCTHSRLIQADMRSIPFVCRSLHFVFSFFSSFGYFANDVENIDVLREINRVLLPGGGILLDYLNADHVRRNLNDEDLQTFPEFSLKQERWINESSNMVEKKLTITDADGTRTYWERVKLYTAEQFNAMLTQSGFAIRRQLGDTDGSAFTSNSPRLVLLGEKVENKPR